MVRVAGLSQLLHARDRRRFSVVSGYDFWHAAVGYDSRYATVAFDVAAFCDNLASDSRKAIDESIKSIL